MPRPEFGSYVSTEPAFFGYSLSNFCYGKVALCLLPTSCVQLLCVLLWYDNEPIVFGAGFLMGWQENMLSSRFLVFLASRCWPQPAKGGGLARGGGGVIAHLRNLQPRQGRSLSSEQQAATYYRNRRRTGCTKPQPSIGNWHLSIVYENVECLVSKVLVRSFP